MPVGHDERSEIEGMGWEDGFWRSGDREWVALGGGRYAVWLSMPWGVDVPALLVVSSLWGWRSRPESLDERWTAFAIGPAVLAIRLVGGLRVSSACLESAPVDSASTEALWV